MPTSRQPRPSSPTSPWSSRATASTSRRAGARGWYIEEGRMNSRRGICRRGFLQTGRGAALAVLAPRAFGARGPIENPKLTLGLAVPAASFLPVYVAAARTWKPEGLDVEIVSFRGDAEVSQAMAGGSLD